MRSTIQIVCYIKLPLAAILYSRVLEIFTFLLPLSASCCAQSIRTMLRNINAVSALAATPVHGRLVKLLIKKGWFSWQLIDLMYGFSFPDFQSSKMHLQISVLICSCVSRCKDVISNLYRWDYGRRPWLKVLELERQLHLEELFLEHEQRINTTPPLILAFASRQSFVYFSVSYVIRDWSSAAWADELHCHPLLSRDVVWLGGKCSGWVKDLWGWRWLGGRVLSGDTRCPQGDHQRPGLHMSSTRHGWTRRYD